MMAKPPPSGPSSDVEGVDKSSKAKAKEHSNKGNAEHIKESDDESKGRPDHHSKRR